MGSSTTQNQTTHNVVTPTNPEWVTNGIEDIFGKIRDLSNLDPQSLVAGVNPLQTQAGVGAAGLTGSPWNFDAAADVTRGVTGRDYSDASNIMRGLGTASAPQVTVASLLQNLGAYMSPYTQQVVDTSLADFDADRGNTLGQQTLDMAGQGAFGGSGSALTRSMTVDKLARARASLDAGLRDQGFTTGANLSNLDAQRRQDASAASAQLEMANRGNQLGAANSLAQLGLSQGDQQLRSAGLLADLSTNFDANARANATTQGTIGDMLRQIQQQQQAAPLSLLSSQAGLLGGLPLALFHGQVEDGTSKTKTKTSDPVGQLGTLAMGLGALGFAPFTGGLSLGGLGTVGGVMSAAKGLDEVKGLY